MGDVSCTQPCQLGFASSDLVVTANRAFLDANPVLEAFLPLVSPDAFELQLLVVEQFNGDGSEAHVQELAQRWVEENGDQIDQWWAEAQLESG
jgi:ABC-type proline/glycine betaine transport system substrate-binding protein